MQTQINAPLQALLQTAAMVTPDKQNSTVAAKVAQAAEQKVGAAPPGIEALLPGVRQQAMMSAQAAQPATQEDVNQLRQMMAQMAPSQGIAPGVDVQMAAEGGIVGYAGPTGSYVRSPEEVEQAEGEKESALRRVLNWLRGKGTVYDPEAPVAPSPRDELAAEVARESRGKPSPDLAKIGAPPQPRVQTRPSVPTPVAQPTAQPTAPAGVDYAKLMQDMMGAQEQGFRRLEELAKPQPKTQEELDFVKRQEEEVARRRAGLEGRRQQFLDLERMREEAGKATGLQDLAAFLTRAGGARTGLAGLAQATQAQAGIDAARRKEAQAALDRRREYFDLLEQQRDAIEDRDVAIRQGRMDRARAAQERVDAINKGIATLRVQTSAQMYGPTIQAGQSAENTRARITAQERMNRERTAAALAAARLKASQVKPPPGMGIGDIQKLNDMVNAEFRTLGSNARRIIGGMPNGQTLLRDIANKNIDLNSESGRAKAGPILDRAMNLYKQELLSQTKFGASPMPYSAAASALGLSPAGDEDED